MLERRVRAATTPQRVVRRSRIALMWLDGQGVEAIATTLKVSRPMVRLWIRRFASGGPDALLCDAPRRGRPVVLEPDVMRQRLEAARLLDESGRPISVRRAAAFLGVSATTVWRALKRSG
jgi:transposase